MSSQGKRNKTRHERIYSSVSILDDLIILEEEGAIGEGGGADYTASHPIAKACLSLMHCTVIMQLSQSTVHYTTLLMLSCHTSEPCLAHAPAHPSPQDGCVVPSKITHLGNLGSTGLTFTFLYFFRYPRIS